MKTLTLCVFLSAFLAPSPQDTPPPLESKLVRELYLAGPPGTLVEYFRLVPQDDVDAEPVGLVRWITGPDPQTKRGWRTEVEVITSYPIVHEETGVRPLGY